MPSRKINAYELKSETRARGGTLNRFLQDSSVSAESKKLAVELLGKFFVHQLQSGPVITEGDKSYRLVHSDPHVGNYVLEMQNGKAKFGVIDRHMYLKMEEADIRVLEKLIVPGNDNDFAYSFIDRILDINEVRGAQRGVISNRVFNNLRIEYIKQRVSGKVDRISLMRTMISSLSESQVSDQFGVKAVDVPLNLRLMIRNIGAFQELGRRYGVDFEALYKQV